MSLSVSCSVFIGSIDCISKMDMASPVGLWMTSCARYYLEMALYFTHRQILDHYLIKLFEVNVVKTKMCF